MIAHEQNRTEQKKREEIRIFPILDTKRFKNRPKNITQVVISGLYL